MRYPIPENDADRVNTLRGYGILDTQPEGQFDDLARLAASICGTPMAVISLVDQDRQWFKSKTGLQACQTPREDAFCAHAIMSPDLFLVPDATQDPRFATNPLVVGEPRIRFYAGAPLTAPNGHHLGALCVMDRVPRQLIPAQLEALRILSRQVMAQVILGKNLHDLAAALRARDDMEQDMQEAIHDLQEASANIQTLKRLVPICFSCKKVRDDRGYWEHVEAYINSSLGVDTTSSICPDCLQKRFGEAPSPAKQPD
ncbi:MAG: GAF domain-containing protein [Verrucomicrobiota bacterium]|jgi:GAF domain-containing protein